MRYRVFYTKKALRKIASVTNSSYNSMDIHISVIYGITKCIGIILSPNYTTIIPDEKEINMVYCIFIAIVLLVSLVIFGMFMKKNKRFSKFFTINLILFVLTVSGTLIIANDIYGYYYSSFRESLDKPYPCSYLDIVSVIPTKSKSIVIMFNKNTSNVEIYKYNQKKTFRGLKYKNKGTMSIVDYGATSNRNTYHVFYDVGVSNKFYPNMFFGTILPEDKSKILVDGVQPKLVDMKVNGFSFTFWYVENVTAKNVTVKFK